MEKSGAAKYGAVLQCCCVLTFAAPEFWFKQVFYLEGELYIFITVPTAHNNHSQSLSITVSDFINKLDAFFN